MVTSTRLVSRPDLTRRQALILAVVLLLGTLFIGIYDIQHTPPGVASDALLDVGDGFRISRGIPFPADFTDRPEMPYRFLLAGWFILFGPHIIAALVGQAFVALVTAALAYRAGLSLLSRYPWRRLGALVAAATMAAIPPYLFMVRSPYRAILVPPVVLVTAIALLSAYRSKKQWRWILAGFLSSLGLQTYLAGVAAPVWAAAVVGCQLVVPPRCERIKLRQAILTAVGMLPVASLWLALVLFVPTYLQRLDQVRSSTGPTLASILDGWWGTIRIFFLDGHPLPTFDAPHAPFVNPVLAVLVILGIGLAVWRWRHIECALLLGGLIILSVPGVVTPDPTYPPRRVGTMPIVSLLAGWGAAWVAARLSAWRRPSFHTARTGLMIGTSVLIVLSLVGTYSVYQSVFADPTRYADPRNWTSIPHNFSMAFEESMQLLAKVDRPTYVPTWMLDNSAALFFLQGEAFPNVTTWARYGLKDLPEGQFFFPVYWYYHMTAIDESTQRVLLLPRDKTIVLLPGWGLPPLISGPPPQAGDPGTTEIKNDRGWTIARLRPVPRSELPADWPPPVSADDPAPVIGNGLRLLTRHPITPVVPGKPTVVLLEWLVTAPQPADVFSVVQLVNQDFVSMPGGSDQHILFYLYPSARWQPGDIIPDWHVVNIPADLPSGIYRWGAGAYVPPSQKRLPITAPDGIDPGPQLNDLWLWDAIRVPAPQAGSVLPADATPVNAWLGEQIALEGYRMIRNDRQWDLTLYWRAQTRPPGDYTIFVHAQRGDRLVAQHDERPLGGKLPTWAWLPGELVTTTYTLEIPAEALEPDTIYVGMYSYPSLERLSAVQNGIPREDRRIVLWSQKEY